MFLSGLLLSRLHLWFLFAFLLYAILLPPLCSSASKHQSDAEDGSDVDEIDLTIYRKMFKEKRRMQQDAIKQLLKMQSDEKRGMAVQRLFDTMLKVIASARVLIERSGFIPGMAFPIDEKLREAVSNVLENVAFFADLALHLPQQTTYAFTTNRDLKYSMQWAFGFCNNTGFYDEKTTQLLSLGAQELDLIKRADDFVNPYRAKQGAAGGQLSPEAMEAQALAASAAKVAAEKEKKRKQKQKAKKGPKLHGGSRSEL